MADSPWIFDVTEAEFEAKVIEPSHRTPVVVDFWATWCGPCKALAPALEKAITARKGEVLLAKVDTDQQPRLAMYYSVEGLPTVLAFKNGKPIDQFVGVLPDDALAQFLDRLGPSEADKKATVGAELEKSDSAKAEQVYREAIAGDRDAEAAELLERLGPGSEQGTEVERMNAILGLRKLTSEMDDEATLRQRLAANEKDATTRYQLGCRLAVAGKHAEALAMLLAAGERDAKLASTKVKEAMVKVFHDVGVRSPLADDYRARLTSLLY